MAIYDHNGQTHPSWKKIQTSPAQYQKIAWDIATKIASGDLREGDKIHSRSGLAGQYNVSVETARRAICILDDLGIVKAVQGSGVVIVSSEKAVQYVRQFCDYRSLGDLRSNLLERINGLHEDAWELCSQLDQFMERVGNFKASNPFVPFHYEVPADSPKIGQTLQDLNFWHNTQATVIAIRRNEHLYLSPGPYMSLHENDVLYYIGNTECIDRVVRLLCK